MGITPTFRCFRMAFPYGFLGRSHPSSGGKLFIDSQPSFLSDPGSPHVLPKLILVPPLQLRHRISLLPPSPEELPTDTRDALVSCCYGVGTPHSFGATIETSHCASFVPVNHKGTEPGIATPNLSQWGHPPTPEVAPPSPLRRPMSDLHGYNEETGERSAPSSPSRRCFADLPDTTTDKQLTSPLQSPLLSGQPLLMLPGAEQDNNLITAEPSMPDWSAPSPPRGSGLGLFLSIQAASSPL
jgi:hypothetical protein